MTSADRDRTHRSDPPLWSMGLAVVVILLAPVVLYSLAPTGPLREGDTVFSQGQQRVAFGTATGRVDADETCLLDPDNPLIILRMPRNQPEDAILAQVQGSPAAEWPFCPAHAQVLLKPHQLYQKPEFLAQAKELFRWVWRRGRATNS